MLLIYVIRAKTKHFVSLLVDQLQVHKIITYIVILRRQGPSLRSHSSKKGLVNHCGWRDFPRHHHVPPDAGPHQTRYAQAALCGTPRGHDGAYDRSVPRLGVLLEVIVSGGPGGGNGAGRPGGVGSRHFLLESSDASEGGGGARAGAACYRLTSPPSPEVTPGASDFRSP